MGAVTGQATSWLPGRASEQSWHPKAVWGFTVPDLCLVIPKEEWGASGELRSDATSPNRQLRNPQAPSHFRESRGEPQTQPCPAPPPTYQEPPENQLLPADLTQIWGTFPCSQFTPS